MLQSSGCSLGFLAFGKHFPRSLHSSEEDELEKSSCSVKLGISLFDSMIELNVNSGKNAGDLLSYVILLSTMVF